MDLKAAVLEAEDVLDLCEYKNIKNKVSGRPESQKKLKANSKEIFAFMLPKTPLRNSLEKLQESADNAKELLDLIRNVPPQGTKRQHSTIAAVTVSNPSAPVFGRDEERDELIDMLISEQHHESSSSASKVTQHAIHGIGGAGKTTLAQYVYHDERVKRHFDTRTWVHVSQNFDTHRITMEITESVGQCTDRFSNLDTLQTKLEQLLNSKKFFLVLDDIWCEDRGEWDKLLIPLNKAGEMGSKILITTRMERVTSRLGVEDKNILSLKELRPEDCWSILKHYAFGDANKVIEDREFVAIGKKIVGKLKNSPLAMRLVGSSLTKKNVDAWKEFLKKDLPEGTSDHVLLLSFRHLPLHLQSCFSFCSLYPKGYSFSKDELAPLWVAEGFVETSIEDGSTAIEKGQEYFDELLSYSFFQPDPAVWSGRYIIHDLLHDLAERVSKGHCLRIEGEPPENIPSTVVHLSIVGGGVPMSSLDALELVNLRTFMHIHPKDDDCPRDMFEMLAKHGTLRVIHLQSSIDKLSSYIGKLKYLRYLKVPGVKELPESLCILYHLQFLILKGDNIERAPERLNNLVRLQHLISGPSTGIRVREIGRLTLLQKLSFYYVEKSRGYGIEQLKNLQQLRGSLTIKGLENVKNKKEAIEAGLNQKKHLEELRLEWERSGFPNTYGRADEEVLEGLEPPPNLRELGVRGYLGANTPGWMTNDQHVQSLNLANCPNLTGVPHGLPTSLEELEIDDCGGLPSLPENLVGLPSLRTLGLGGCPKMGLLPNLPTSLEKLRIDDCGGLPSLPENLEGLPSLRTLRIYGCPKMGSLPSLPTSLEWLEIGGCDSLPSLPENLEGLPSLRTLQIDRCPKMGSMPSLPTSLEQLEIGRCGGLPSLPENLEGLPSLRTLRIDGCPKMGSLPSLPTSLEKLWIRGCGGLPSLPENLEGLPSLQTLRIDGCPKMGSLPSLPTSLEELWIDDCGDLPSLPENLEGLPSLRTLWIHGCMKMGLLPSLPTSLEKLRIDDCGGLPSLPENLEGLPSLRTLRIYGCTKMGSLPSLPTSLEELRIRDCDDLPSLPENLEGLPSLQTLRIGGCPKLGSLSSLPTSLEELEIRGCGGLPSLPENLDGLPSLRKLEIGGCPKMVSLPSLPTSLKWLKISNCNSQLKKKYAEGGPLRHKINHIPKITIEECM